MMLVMYTAAVTALKPVPIIQSHSIPYGSVFATAVFDCVFVHSTITYHKNKFCSSFRGLLKAVLRFGTFSGHVDCTLRKSHSFGGDEHQCLRHCTSKFKHLRFQGRQHGVDM